MASSTEEGDTAAAAAEQLASMSLGETAERRGENNEDAEKNEAQAKMCSACEKKSDALMKCRACKCVWYCDKKCQNKHWKEHKNECKPIKKALDKRGGKLDVGTELDVGPLEKPPPREECPICMQVLPIHENLQTYTYCCGKTLCGACDHQHWLKTPEVRTEGGQIAVPRTCAFCRTAVPGSDEEMLAQLSKRVELKDPEALKNLALCYGRGYYMDYGFGHQELPVDQAKCIELLRQSAGLGYPPAQYTLGNFYDDGAMGLEQNEAKALEYWEKAAEGGHLKARHNLGCTEDENGNENAAMRHWRVSASGGYKASMDALISCFEGGFLHHEDLAETLQAMYRCRAELKSEDRDKYIKHLKMTGEYEAEYEF